MNARKYFFQLRDEICNKRSDITAGQMMSSPAMTINNKVFCFISRKDKLVVKLGAFTDSWSDVLTSFSPLKSKRSLTGWWEADYQNKIIWVPLINQALENFSNQSSEIQV